MNRLGKLIENKGLKKTQVARACGVSYNTVYKWCRGLRRPKPKQFKMMSKFLNVKIAELYEIVYGGED